MSYNITSCQIAASKGFCITVAAYKALQAELADSEELPETNILDDGWLKYGATVKDGKIYPKSFWWSGNDYHQRLLQEKVLPAFHGTTDLVFVWEGGDSFTGLRYARGMSVKREVAFSLK
jgi:hypothetical protein